MNLTIRSNTYQVGKRTRWMRVINDSIVNSYYDIPVAGGTDTKQRDGIADYAHVLAGDFDLSKNELGEKYPWTRIVLYTREYGQVIEKDNGSQSGCGRSLEDGTIVRHDVDEHLEFKRAYTIDEKTFKETDVEYNPYKI